MGFHIVDGRKIYYEIHGENSKKGSIVLLHHGFGCAKIWKHIYPVFVKEGYQIIMYDRRGYGRSEPGPDFMEFYVSSEFRSKSVEDMAKLMSFLHINSFHIIGQCEGGVIGVDYASSYQEQVETLVTSSTQCFSRVAMREKNASDFPKSFEELDAELQDKMIDWHGERAEAFFEQFRRFGGAYGSDRFDLRGSLSNVECPSLVLYPDRSALFDVEQGVSFYKHLPKGELAVIPACGHNTYDYRPDDYLRIVLDFFKRHKSDENPSGLGGNANGISCLAVRR